MNKIKEMKREQKEYSLRCKSCDTELIDFENKGFCYECYLAYDSDIEIDIEDRTEEIINDLE